jgi:hypothetical protein
MSTKSRKTYDIKTVNLGGKKVELRFPGTIPALPKGKWASVTASYDDDDGVKFIDAKYQVDNDNVVSIKTEKGEFRYKQGADGNLKPADGGDLFGGVSPRQDTEALASAKEQDDREYALGQIAYRFMSVRDGKLKFHFWALVMDSIHKWLVANGHGAEAACLLSFVTKVPIIGAVIYLQFITPMDKQLPLYYLPTKLLSAWLKSDGADRVFGFSTPEENYKKVGEALFATAVEHFAAVKKDGKALIKRITSLHHGAGTKNLNDAEKHYDNILSIYTGDLASAAGNRVSVAEETPILLLHDALSAWSLRLLVEQGGNIKPETIIKALEFMGVRTAVDAQFFKVKSTNDEEGQKAIIKSMLKWKYSEK